MNVLCLYNHAEYGAPMVRSASSFDAHGIKMKVVRVADEAEAANQLDQPFDVLLLQEPEVHESLLDCGRPVVLLERTDGAQLRASRRYLGRVAGVIKSYLFRDRQDYNRIFDRAHVRLLHRAGIQASRPLYRESLPQPQLSGGDVAKLHVGYSGFGCHDIIRTCIETEVDFDAPRSCEVHFAATVAYENTEVQVHRQAAFDCAEQWSGESIATAGRGTPREQYYADILNSKAVLCPWGWGEATYRDYEAMALGAVVIKPDTSHVEAWPDIYRAGETYVPSRPDFVGVHAKIQDIRDNWESYRPMREQARRLVVEAWQPEAIAGRIADLLKEIVG